MVAPKSLEVDPSQDPVSHFGALQEPVAARLVLRVGKDKS